MGMPMAQEAAAVALGRGEQVGAAEPPARTEASAQDSAGDTLGVGTVTGQVDNIAQHAALTAEANTHGHIPKEILVDLKLIGPVAVACRVHETETEMGERQHA